MFVVSDGVSLDVLIKNNMYTQTRLSVERDKKSTQARFNQIFCWCRVETVEWYLNERFLRL